jgi:hypothetical protein
VADDLDVALSRAAAFSVPVDVLKAKLAAEYERGRTDREREIAEERRVALIGDDPGPATPYEPSQVQIDVESATPDQLRTEISRLDLRLRWVMRHYDDHQTVGLLAMTRLGDEIRRLRRGQNADE